MKGKLILIFTLSLLLATATFSSTNITGVQPDPLPSGQGDQFDVTFTVNMGGAILYGLQVWVDYNEDAIAPVGAAPFTAVVTPTGGIQTNVVDVGICKYRATWVSPGISPSGDALVKLTFEVLDGTQTHDITMISFTSATVSGTCYKINPVPFWNSGTTSGFDEITQVPDFPLPVLLSSFEASPGNGFVNLQWVTQSEVDNQEFTIYRGVLGNNNVPIARIKSINSNSQTAQAYTYCDNRVDNDRTYSYLLSSTNLNGEEYFLKTVEAMPTENSTTQIPMDFKLSQNYPNPFNNSTTINFSLHEYGHTTLTLYNIMGEVVETLFDNPSAAPISYQVTVNADELPSGVYFYVLSAPDNYSVKKLVLMK